MGKCVVRGRGTEKVLFTKAVIKTYICSLECLHKYLGAVKVQKKLSEEEGWLD